MRILIDILHPAHVHFLWNFHDEIRDLGHDLCITARAKDQSLELLDQFGLPYRHISSQRDGRLAAVAIAQRTGRLLKMMHEFRPDVMTGIMGPSIAVAGAVRRVPAVVFYDTEFAVQTNRFVYLDGTQWLRSGPIAAGGRALAPLLDWTARRTTALGRPQLDLATRKVEWLASLRDPARHYLLLRNA